MVIAKRAANRDHKITGLEILTVSEASGAQIFCINFYKSKIGYFVAANDRAFEFALVIERYRNRICISHHVVVGQDVAVGPQNQAGAYPFFLELPLMGLLVTTLPEEKIKWPRRQSVIVKWTVSNRDTASDVDINDTVSCFLGDVSNSIFS